MDKNSRTYTRKLPAKFGFIQIVGDEGGRILNISEAGLCFETFAPLGHPKNIQFWFSLNLHDRIEGSGEVAWLDAETKIGGLRFQKLPQRALDHIRKNSTAFPGTGCSAKGHLFIEAVARQAASQRAANPDRSPSNEFQGSAMNFRALTPSLDSDSSNASHAVVDSTDLISLQRHRAISRRQLVFGILIGVLFSLVVALPAFKYFSGRQQRTVSADVRGSSASFSATSQSDAASEPERVASAATPALPPAPANGQQSSLSKVSAYNATLGNSTLSASPFSNSSTVPIRGAKPTAAQPAEISTSPARRSGGTPQQLWSAVQAGDSNAAVLLADRYMRGDGVPMNCLQARVLLLVASEKKNPAAVKKLHELDKTGCS